MAILEMTTPCNSSTATDPLSPSLFERLRQIFTPRQVAYIAHVLCPDELRVVGDLADALFIARIKRMPSARLDRYDRFVPKNEEAQRFYQRVQAQWLRDEEYLLGTRLGRRPTQRELFIDFMNNHNGQRFRAYFTMKHPQCMRDRRVNCR